MLEKLLTGLSAVVISVISGMGYGGVILLMAIESACIPLPSEVIMPFAGIPGINRAFRPAGGGDRGRDWVPVGLIRGVFRRCYGRTGRRSSATAASC